jgi:hypothetical protein
VIRQAISCDICATEKRQTNHWFVAYEQGGELRVSGWSSRHRLRPGAKHLCGQTCLHKLVDDFVARSIAVRAQRPADETEAAPATHVDTSLTSGAAYTEPASPRAKLQPAAEETESSARLLTPPERVLPKPIYRPQTELLTMPSRPHPGENARIPEETPRYNSRNWRAEAWERERERERELRAIENRPDMAARRRSNA